VDWNENRRKTDRKGEKIERKKKVIKSQMVRFYILEVSVCMAWTIQI